METARAFAKRSTCSRLQVGCVIANADLTNVVAIGYNGSARGKPNECESQEPGKCGHMHAELNALVKADFSVPSKVMFITHSPCLYCSKYIVNAGINCVFFDVMYRDASALDFLKESGITVGKVKEDGEIEYWKQEEDKKPEDEKKPPPPQPKNAFVPSEHVPRGGFVRKP